MTGASLRLATRIVSLVPSVTESLFCLGLGDRVGLLRELAARNGRIHFIDGTLVSWYGPRIEPAIALLRTLFSV